MKPCARCRQERPQCSRGLCRHCWHWASKHGALTDYQRVQRPAEDVVEEAAFLADTGEGVDGVAARLGYAGRKSLYKALSRAGRLDIWRRLQGTPADIHTRTKVA